MYQIAQIRRGTLTILGVPRRFILFLSVAFAEGL